MNKYIAIGYVGKKGVDLRTLGDKGTSCGTFTLSVERKFKNKEGKKEYDFINCKVWGKQAEFLSDKVESIKKVAIEGELRTYTFDRKDGSKGYGWEVNCSDVQVVEWNNSDNPSTNQSNDFTPVDNGEDIPF